MEALGVQRYHMGVPPVEGIPALVVGKSKSPQIRG
jgi:hypothetical protein